MPSPVKGTVHRVQHIQGFELEGHSDAQNAVIFLGGLGDGLLTVPYVEKLALPADWTIYNIVFSSSYKGWGTGSLDRDADEIALFVEYLRGLKKEKIVLMGHSTGTQDSIHYLLKKGDVDGIILQAPVSDRETMGGFIGREGLDKLNKEAIDLKEQYGEDHILPAKFGESFLPAPITCYRWLSMSLKGGDDDYFSGDLEEEQLANTFGKLTKPTLILYSGADEYALPTLDKEALVKNWNAHIPEKFQRESSVIPGAKHNVGEGSAEDAVEILSGFVYRFLSTI